MLDETWVCPNCDEESSLWEQTEWGMCETCVFTDPVRLNWQRADETDDGAWTPWPG